MKYLYGLVAVVVVLVAVALYYSTESHTEPAQDVLVTNLEYIKGLKKVEGYCE